MAEGFDDWMKEKVGKPIRRKKNLVVFIQDKEEFASRRMSSVPRIGELVVFGENGGTFIVTHVMWHLRNISENVVFVNIMKNGNLPSVFKKGSISRD